MPGRISDLAKSALFDARLTLEMFYLGMKTDHLVNVAGQAMALAKKASSNIAYIKSSSIYIHNCIYQMNFAETGSELIADIKNPTPAELSALAYYKTLHGVFLLVSSSLEKSHKILEQTVNYHLFESFPVQIQFMGYYHALLFYAFIENNEEIQKIIQKLNSADLPPENHFPLSFRSFLLAIAFLSLGKPETALEHLHQAERINELAESHEPVNHIALLAGLIFSDLHKIDKAMAHFQKWIGIWKALKNSLYVMTAYLEISNLLIKENKINQARKYYKKACSLWPGKNRPHAFNRSKKFTEHLEQCLFPEVRLREPAGSDTCPVICIQTFGNLCVRVGSNCLKEEGWKSVKAKDLLKLLIVQGGTNIPSELLADILWPEKDGDLAKNSLKVTVSRLRKIVSDKTKPTIKWIQVHHQQISLSKSLCVIDCIRFQELLCAGLKQGADISLLKQALDLYADDFLINDFRYPQIISYRDFLKKEFTKGSLVLSNRCIKNREPETAIPYLSRAIEKTPLDTDIYIRLMQTWLQLGYPSKALSVYQQAETIFQQELGIEPGPVLQALARKAKKL